MTQQQDKRLGVQIPAQSLPSPAPGASVVLGLSPILQGCGEEEVRVCREPPPTATATPQVSAGCSQLPVPSQPTVQGPELKSQMAFPPLLIPP